MILYWIVESVSKWELLQRVNNYSHLHRPDYSENSQSYDSNCQFSLEKYATMDFPNALP